MEKDKPKQKVQRITFSNNNDFELQLLSFKQKLNNLGEDQKYSISVYDCLSHKQVGLLFQLLFAKPNINLAYFTLSGCCFSLNEFELFTTAKLPNLQCVEISFSDFDDQCAFQFSKCKLANVDHLQFDSAHISSIGFSHIFECDLPKLKSLNLWNLNLGKHSVKHLTKSQWNTLVNLSLIKSNLQSESLKVISKCPWKSLKSVSLSRNPIIDDSIDSLCYANWPKLEELSLQRDYQYQITHLGSQRMAKLAIQVTIDKDIQRTKPKVMSGMLFRRILHNIR